MFAEIIVLFLPNKSDIAPVGISKMVKAIASTAKIMATLVTLKRFFSKYRARIGRKKSNPPINLEE
jgi:hypothetical protein